MNPTNLAVRLRLDQEILQRQAASGRPFVCPIWMEIDSLNFPSAEWSDFPIVILGWWMDQSLSLHTGKTSEAILRFMDGPYELIMTRVHEDYWAAMPLVRGLSVQQGATYVLRGSQVISELQRASHEILSACRALQRWTKDCEILEKLVQHS